MVKNKPSSLVTPLVIFCRNNLDRLRKLPDGCVDHAYVDPPFRRNRNYKVLSDETKEKRAPEGRHAATEACPSKVRRKEQAGHPDINMFEATMARADRNRRFHASFGFGRGAEQETDAYFENRRLIIIPPTAQASLNQEIAKKCVS